MKPSLVDNLRPVLNGRKILLGISGSIAAFKACDLIRLLRDAGAETRCVLTANAQKFVTTTTLETLSGNPVSTSLWNDGLGTHHIDVARWADLAVVAPATANTIAKLALGLCDDLLSTELLAATCPLVVAPAMNPAMYAHPAVQHNVSLLKSRGARLLGPAQGLMACGEEGAGRMEEPATILEAVAQSFYAKTRLQRLLLTMGPTRSPIDPVRYLTNRSSGLMGAALAWSAVRAGYDVSVISGPIASDVLLPRDIELTRVDSAQEMYDAAARRFGSADIFVASAAVLDWDVTSPAPQKLKKENGTFGAGLEFSQNPDILGELSRKKRPGQFILGFAAETDALLENARLKLERKGCDAIFLNDVSKPGLGFESAKNAGWWISANGVKEFTPMDKLQLADELIALMNQSAKHASREDILWT